MPKYLQACRLEYTIASKLDPGKAIERPGNGIRPGQSDSETRQRASVTTGRREK